MSALRKNLPANMNLTNGLRYLLSGVKAITAGRSSKLPDHAKTLRLIGETDAKSLYEGEIAQQLVKQSKRDGGYFSLDDLKDYKASWVEPIRVNYHGYDVWEIPPNGQGIVALMALNILKEFDFKEKTVRIPIISSLRLLKWHLRMVCIMSLIRIAWPLIIMILLKPEYGKARAAEIGKTAKEPKIVEPPKSGTVYL